MLYSCTHTATVGIKGLNASKWHKFLKLNIARTSQTLAEVCELLVSRLLCSCTCTGISLTSLSEVPGFSQVFPLSIFFPNCLTIVTNSSHLLQLLTNDYCTLHYKCLDNIGWDMMHWSHSQCEVCTDCYVTMTCDAPDVFDSRTLYWVNLQHAFQQVNGRLVEMFRHREQTSYKHSQTYRQTDTENRPATSTTRHTDRHTDRQTQRTDQLQAQPDTQIDIQTDRHREQTSYKHNQTHRQTYRQTGTENRPATSTARHTDRHTDRQTDRHH